MKIYVIRGSTGEYSDCIQWLVCAYADEEPAKRHVELASEWARKEQIARDADWDRVEDDDNPYDPLFRMSYNGTGYTYEEVRVHDEVPEVQP